MTLKTILVAHDFSDSADRALAFAAELAKQTECALHLVYVLPDIYHGNSDLSLALPAAIEGQGERYMRFLEQELERIAKPIVGADVPVTAHVVHGEPSECIQELARELHGDAVCIGATGKRAAQRLMLGSVAQRTLRMSHVPVITVP